MYLDIHAHLDLCGDVESMMKRARDVLVVTNGLGTESNRKCLDIAGKYGNVLVALGLYPSELLKMDGGDISREIEFISENKDRIIGIGEVGLDFSYEGHSKQTAVFKKMIDLSFDLDVPLIVHSRKAEKDVLNILEKKGAKKVVLHCFNGNFKLVSKIVDNGWMLSIPLIIFRSKHFQGIAENVPVNNILTETDSPYLGRDGENEPANVKLIVEKIAFIKKMNKKIVEKRIFSNFERFFGKKFVFDSESEK
ncbi:MAG: TatD family hydrolase [Nanoarchaeota archaeon]|nr:TatD family hydrolase [Nanoarchaeota archaeon]